MRFDNIEMSCPVLDRPLEVLASSCNEALILNTQVETVDVYGGLMLSVNRALL